MDAACPGQHPSDHQWLPSAQAQGNRSRDVREGHELPRQGGLQPRAGARHRRHQRSLLLYQGPSSDAAGQEAQVSEGEAGAGGRQAPGGQPQEEDGHQTIVINIGWAGAGGENWEGGASEAGLVAASQHWLQRVGDRGGRRGGW